MSAAEIAELLESAVGVGINLARDELRKNGLTVSDDAAALVVRVITGLWRTEPGVVNAQTIALDDQRTKPA